MIQTVPDLLSMTVHAVWFDQMENSSKPACWACSAAAALVSNIRKDDTMLRQHRLPWVQHSHFVRVQQSQYAYVVHRPSVHHVLMAWLTAKMCPAAEADDKLGCCL